MDWSTLTNMPSVGWPTAIALAIVLAGLFAGSIYESRKRREKELRNAEKIYRAAIASGDPDLIHIAAKRLRYAQRRAS